MDAAATSPFIRSERWAHDSNGLRCQARSATQGECSKTQPTVSMNSSWAKRLIFLIDNGMAGYTNFFDALGARKCEECCNHSLGRFHAFQYPGEYAAFRRPEIDKD